MRTSTTILNTTLLITLSGCGNGGQDPVVGKWQEVGGNDRSEYFADGTAIFNDGSMSLSGKWQRLEDGRLKVEASFLGMPVAEVYQADTHGDEVTFTNSKGKVQRYRRADR